MIWQFICLFIIEVVKLLTQYHNLLRDGRLSEKFTQSSDCAMHIGTAKNPELCLGHHKHYSLRRVDRKTWQHSSGLHQQTTMCGTMTFGQM